MYPRRVQQPPQLRGDARRRERDARGRPAEAPLGRKHFDGPQYGVGIVERLAHTHKNDVGQAVAFGQRLDLIENLGRRERMLQSLPAGGAETAAHAAARLRRDAERGAVAVGDIGRFDEMPLHGTEQVLLRSVGRRADPDGCRKPRVATFGEPHARRRRQVGHRRRVGRVPAVEPAGDLAGGEPRQRQLFAEPPQFGHVFSVEVFHKTNVRSGRSSPPRRIVPAGVCTPPRRRQK